ncbi:MAG: RnfABCDGE type electron transport complex subunit D [Candidatus Omnitrophica bacterium]|nr:RnfABCDGE type electron transport complex subunit D [Candidatus Omnitrophota bacterium]
MKMLTINVAPHVFTPVDTRYMVRGVIKALIPATCASLYFFRWQAFLVIIASIAGCVLTEYAIQKFRKKQITLGDSSAVLTGLLLALVLPPVLPLWMAFLGGVFAIAFGKEIFGGIGCNIFNPALLARAFLMATFPVALTTWSQPITLDAVTTATPLGLIKFGGAATPYMSLFLGNVGGCIGETSAIALLLGMGYLLYTKIIDYRVPLAYIATVAVFAFITHAINPKLFPGTPLFHILAGGLLIGAIFMATDPVTSPVTAKGRWIFGIGCGLITMIIRIWGGLPEGVMYSILCMNALAPLINRVTKPKRYGETREK